MRTHPMLIIGGILHENPFFVPPDEFLQELRALAEEVSSATRATLTEREREVTRLLAAGQSNKDVATALAISVRTVETHRASIMRKLEIKSIVELVHYAVRHNLVRP